MVGKDKQHHNDSEEDEDEPNEDNDRDDNRKSKLKEVTDKDAPKGPNKSKQVGKCWQDGQGGSTRQGRTRNARRMSVQEKKTKGMFILTLMYAHVFVCTTTTTTSTTTTNITTNVVLIILCY